MDAARDSHWMSGAPHWYPTVEGIPERVTGEADAPESWSATTPQVGGRGWMRQRLSPLGAAILYSTAWAPFFLVISALPLAFPGNTPNDQYVALGLFLASWLLLIVPFTNLRDGLENQARTSALDTYPVDAILILVGAAFFALHILIDPRIGWISFAIFAYAQYRTIANISASVSMNSARWLLPITKQDFSPDILTTGWEASSKTFRNGPLAVWIGPLPEYAATLIGVTRGDSSFVAFALKHRGGTLHDPFSESLVADSRFDSLLAAPPLTIAGEAWPDRFGPSGEQ